MRKAIGLVVIVGVLFGGAPGAWAQRRRPSQAQEGRYQIFFSPTDRDIVYLVDTREGRVWRATVDEKLKLPFWRPVPVEGLDYPISTYTKQGVEFFFEHNRGLSIRKGRKKR